jgi:tetratricopeptide (TPR) repeat protein
VHYQAGMDIRKKLTELDLSNTQFQRDVSVSHDKVGDLQLRLGNSAPALAHYQASMKINKKLTELDPSNTQFQRDVSVSHDKLGNLQLLLGKTAPALVNYQASVKIRKKFIKLDPGNSQFQYDLLLSYMNIARVHAKEGNYTSAANSVISYIEFAGIDVRNQKITNIKLTLLQNFSGLYHYWSWYMLYTEKVSEVPTILTKVIDYLDGSDENTVMLHSNLAHAYLLSGNYQSAKSVYEKYKAFIFKGGNTWDKAIINNFKTLEKNGITHPDFARIAKEVFGTDFPDKKNIKSE